MKFKILTTIVAFLIFFSLTPSKVMAESYGCTYNILNTPHCELNPHRSDCTHTADPLNCNTITDRTRCNNALFICPIDATPTPAGVVPPTIAPFEPPSNETFNALNPLRIAGGNDVDTTTASPYADELSNPGGVVSRILKFSIPIAGLILFAMLVWGGFEILVGAPSGKSIDAGKQRITAAIIGFILLFASYWLMQIIEVIFGVVIL